MSNVDQDLRNRAKYALNNAGARDRLVLLLEAGADPGSVAAARFALPNQPTLADTATIGVDVYEFVNIGGNVTDDANIAVAIGASAAETLTNWVAAINATYKPNENPFVNNVADDAPALANGTEFLFADVLGTDLRIRSAKYAGGPVAAADPDILLAENVTDAADVWREGDVNLNTLAGRAEGVRGRAVAELAITAQMITDGTVRLDFPFVVAFFTVQVRTALGAIRAAGTDAYTLDNDGVLVTFGGGGDPDIQATDVLQLIAWA